MAPTPEWFFVLMMTHVVPAVLAFMVAGTVLGLLVKGMRSAARRALESGRQRR